MVECGLLRDRRVELLRGDIVEISPESPIHYATAKRGSKYLETLLAGRADVRFNGPITLTNSEPEPDIAIVRRSPRWRFPISKFPWSGYSFKPKSSRLVPTYK